MSFDNLIDDVEPQPDVAGPRDGTSDTALERVEEDRHEIVGSWPAPICVADLNPTKTPASADQDRARLNHHRRASNGSNGWNARAEGLRSDDELDREGLSVEGGGDAPTGARLAETEQVVNHMFGAPSRRHNALERLRNILVVWERLRNELGTHEHDIQRISEVMADDRQELSSEVGRAA